MTLGPYRVRMGKRIAAAPGIPYVSVTRAKHPRHLCFDVDLQDHDVFTEAQWSKNFRARRRYDLRLEAKFSRTLRKYGYCRADPWERSDAELAEKLLEGLKKVRGVRRGSAGHLGTNFQLLASDPDANLWHGEEPPLEALLLESARDLAHDDVALLSRAQAVLGRLLGPLHRPAVLEAIGALIPLELHPRYDGRKPRAKVGAGNHGIGVHLEAGRWTVGVDEESSMRGAGAGAEGRLAKGVLEFFLIIFRRVTECMELPVAVGSHRLGQDIHFAEDVAFAKAVLRVQETWGRVSARIAAAEYLLLPVVLDESKVPRDCVLVTVKSSNPGEPLARATTLRVEVVDALKRARLASRLASKVCGLVATLESSTASPEVEVSSGPFAQCSSPFERAFAVLGMILQVLLKGTDRACCSVEDAAFLASTRNALCTSFSELRMEADKRESRDVLLQLSTKASCERFLNMMSEAHTSRAVVSPVPACAAAPTRVRKVEVSDFQPLQILSWNIAADSKSRLAPESFSVADKMAAVQQEILRWSPDIVALQECSSSHCLS